MAADVGKFHLVSSVLGVMQSADGVGCLMSGLKWLFWCVCVCVSESVGLYRTLELRAPIERQRLRLYLRSKHTPARPLEFDSLGGSLSQRD